MNYEEKLSKAPISQLSLPERYYLGIDFLKGIGYSDEQIAVAVHTTRTTLAKQRRNANSIKLSHYQSLTSELIKLGNAMTYANILRDYSQPEGSKE